jgi:alpha-amylase
MPPPVERSRGFAPPRGLPVPYAFAYTSLVRSVFPMVLALACTSPPGLPPMRPIDSGFVAPRRDAASDAQAERDAGRDAFVEAASFDARTWQGSVIYFVLTDRFSNGDRSNDGDATCTDPASPTLFHGGDFAGLADRLDYIEELGADAIWITPVLHQLETRHGDQCGYHGYWADLTFPDDGALEAKLGGAEGLDALIDAVHARGMRLIVDYVVNHPGRNARITRDRPEFFHPDRPACEGLGDPEITCSLSGLPDFAHEREDVREYLDAMSDRFVRRFAFDAIRMDTVKHVPASYYADHWIPTVTAARPDLYLVGELFDEGGSGPQDR